MSTGRIRTLVGVLGGAAFSFALLLAHRATDRPKATMETRPPAPAIAAPRGAKGAVETPKIHAIGRDDGAVDPPAEPHEEELSPEIDALEETLSQKDAIARLNDGRAGPEERKAYGAMIERLSSLRLRAAERGLEELSRELGVYAEKHPERVSKYTTKE